MARSSTFKLLLATGVLVFTLAIYLTKEPEYLPAIEILSEDETVGESVPAETVTGQQPEETVAAVVSHTPVSTVMSAPQIAVTPIPTDVSTRTGTQAADQDLNADTSNVHGQLIIPKIELQQDTVHLPLVEGYWPVDELGAEIGLLGGTGEHPYDDMSMVFAGHVTTYWPISGPFAAVDELVPNDEIVYIYEEQAYVYKISRLLFAEPDQVNMLLSDRGDQIILVTCGQYDYFNGSYDGRLVVLADLIEVNPILYSES